MEQVEVSRDHWDKVTGTKVTDKPMQLFDTLDLATEAALRASVERFGVLVPVVKDQNGRVLDGHHRSRIADDLGVDYRVDVVQVANDAEAADIARTLNADRRHLDRDQRRQVVADLRSGGHSLRAIAGAVGVGKDTVAKDLGQLSTDRQLDTPERVVGLDGKSRPATRPTPPAVIPAKNQREAEKAQTALAELNAEAPDMAERVRAGDVELGKAHRLVKQRTTRQERRSRPLPEGRYGVILADPPWRYQHSESANRDIENHYPTMALDEIKALDVPAADNAVLYLWATPPKLTEAVEVMDAWGFGYRTCMVWVKDKIGMGYWARQRHELVLIGVRGDMPPPEPGDRPDSVVEAPRGEHSAKPDRLHDIIDAVWPQTPKIELFSRRERDGWTAWGNEPA